MSYKAYSSSVLNEAIVDEYLYGLQGVDPKYFFFMPRFHRVNLKDKFCFIYFALFFIYYLWPFFFIPVFSFFNLFYYLCKKIFSDKCSSSFLYRKKVFLISSSEGVRRISHATKMYSVVAIKTPRLNLKNSDNLIVIDPISLVPYYKILNIFFVSIFYSCRFSLFSKHGKLRLQTYTSFEWLLMYEALKGIDADFYMEDHFDRWAVLYDSLTLSKKKDGHYISLSLVQHGLLSLDFEDSSLGLPFKLFYKLSQIDKLFVYDSNSEKIFKRDILGNDWNGNVVFSLPQLVLTPYGSEKVIVLFVGHPICEGFHRKVAHGLCEKINFDNVIILYKPHPTKLKVDNHISDKWKLYENDGKFPDVDVVISYPSTLAYEYHLLGIKVFRHPIEEKLINSDVIVDDVVKFLERA
mgnify:CR=1 FL=1|tara:strand:- start:2011 stop:3234 length:1224 start_codon:yes stop_codon:yes gene_type:complete